MVFSKALGGWGQDWSRENSNLALWSPHLLGWLSPQQLLQLLPSTPTAGPPSSFPSPSRGVVTGQAAIGGDLGPETHGLLAQCGWSRGSAACGASGPQAKSPPPEVFFLGRVFSVLEASGCWRERGCQRAQPRLTSPPHVHKLSPQLWALF